MLRHFCPLLALALVASLAAPAEARRNSASMGIGGGATMFGGSAQVLQPNLAADVTFQVEDVLEMSLGAQTRDLALVPNAIPSYGLQSSGLTAGMALRLANLSFGFQAEGALLRNVTSAGPGNLTINQGFGFIGEPYITVHLAGILAVTGYYPVVKPDPAFGPRVLVQFRVPLDD